MIALVISAPWWQRSATKAGLDLAMTLASFDMPFELFIQGPACAMQTRDAPTGHPAKTLASLALYGKSEWFTDTPGDWIEGATVVTATDINARIRACTQVIRL